MNPSVPCRGRGSSPPPPFPFPPQSLSLSLSLCVAAAALCSANALTKSPLPPSFPLPQPAARPSVPRQHRRDHPRGQEQPHAVRCRRGGPLRGRQRGGVL
uniref:Uncharacterized protein n=1 Tax=Tetraselmis sp. GSL018 TaxID=582737 RepID=A0A061R5S5_9CHLO